jgi:hypothetical protein
MFYVMWFGMALSKKYFLYSIAKFTKQGVAKCQSGLVRWMLVNYVKAGAQNFAQA